jgi:predicted RNA-binding Zn-ribbon protein involved in translation (DUF1610 family)
MYECESCDWEGEAPEVYTEEGDSRCPNCKDKYSLRYVAVRSFGTAYYFGENYGKDRD